MMGNNPLCICTITSLFIHLLMDIYNPSSQSNVSCLSLWSLSVWISVIHGLKAEDLSHARTFRIPTLPAFPLSPADWFPHIRSFSCFLLEWWSLTSSCPFLHVLSFLLSRRTPMNSSKLASVVTFSWTFGISPSQGPLNLLTFSLCAILAGLHFCIHFSSPN